MGRKNKNKKKNALPSESQSTIPSEFAPESSNIMDYNVDCSISNFTYINQLPNSCVYEGRIKSEENESSVSVLHFRDQKEAQMHHNFATDLLHRADIFRPLFQFRYSEESGQGVLNKEIVPISVISVGHTQGVPLCAFIDNLQPAKVWQYDSTTLIYMRAGEDFRKLGKLLGSLLFRLHKEGACIGGDLLNRIFVMGDGTNTPLSLVVMGYQRFNVSEFVDGVVRDLSALREFVEYVESTKPMKQTRARFNQIRDNMYDLVMFYKLFPEVEDDWPQQKNDILDLSYIVCHAPLFWDHEQRSSFVSSYCHFRISHTTGEFDSHVSFNEYPIMATWEQTVRTKQRFNDVYDHKANRSLRLIGAAGVIPFHRSVQVHHARDSRIMGNKITALKADNDLVQTFPYAIPIAYFVLCKRLNAPVVEFLIAGGLDYSQS